MRINRRLGPGEVRIDPHQINTSPAKKGNPGCYPKTTLGPKVDHLPDEYDRIKKKEIAEAKASRAKMQEVAFKRNSHGNRPFSGNQKTYGYDGPAIPTKMARCGTAPTGVNRVAHEAPFYPSKPPKSSQADRTLAPFPEYKEDPLRQVKRAPKTEEEAPPAWKVTYRDKTRPSSSVVGMKRNIRREAFRSFKRF